MADGYGTETTPGGSPPGALPATTALPVPGALGFVLRKWVLKHLCRSVGTGVVLGRNVALRHPGKIDLGDRAAIDDNCLLDAKGAGEAGVKIGNDVVVARDTLIQGKASWVEIGDNCIIGSQCQISSVSGVSLGDSVMLAGQSYIGGGRYHSESRDVPPFSRKARLRPVKWCNSDLL